MKIADFKKMFYTSFGRGLPDDKKHVYEMLLPLIVANDDSKDNKGDDYGNYKDKNNVDTKS